MWLWRRRKTLKTFVYISSKNSASELYIHTGPSLQMQGTQSKTEENSRLSTRQRHFNPSLSMQDVQHRNGEWRTTQILPI